MKTLRYLFLLFILTSVLVANKRISAHYDISYAIFGVIGESVATLTVDKDRYHIQIKANAKGVAKVMSGSRIELFESKGEVVKGFLVPQEFRIVTKKGKYYLKKERFVFHHAQKRVAYAEEIDDHDTKIENKKQLDYYAKEDILTLFFNLRRYLQKGFCQTGKCSFIAVGANEKDGRVDIEVKGDGNFTVVLHRRIFASKEGRMDIALNEEGICTYALLKDVIFFGDIKAKVTKIRHQK